MADARLKIIVGAEDKASPVLSGIGRAVGGIGRVAGTALLGGIGLATGAVAGLGLVLKDSLGEAIAAEEGQAQLAAVIKSTGGAAGVTVEKANAYAGALSEVTRYEDDTVLAAESLLLTFTNISDDIFPAVTEMALDMSTALGQDTKSSAMQLGKALNDPIKGITALTRVGVTFTAEQKKQIEALQKSGRTMEAQKIILQELQREFGGSARAAGETLAGQMDILNNRIGNIKESIGTALLPGVTQLAQAFGPVLTTAAEGFGRWLEGAGPKLATFATNAGNVVSAISEFGVKSPEARDALEGLFGENIGGKVADVAGWLADAKTNMSDLLAVVQDKGWDSTETLGQLSEMFGPTWATPIQQGGSALRDISSWLGTALPTVAAEQLKTFKTDALQAVADGGRIANQYITDLKTSLGIAPNTSGWSGIAGTFRDIAAAIENANAKLTEWINKANSALGAGGPLFNYGPTPNVVGVPGYTPPAQTPGTGGRTFAAGTLWAPGGMALVGERGPELVMLPRGSRVADAAETERRAGSGQNVTYNITVNGARDRREAQAGVRDALRAVGVA